MRATIVVLVALCIASRADAGRRDGTQSAIATLTKVAGCGASPKHKAWCLAAGWANGKAAPLPKKTLVGIAVSTGSDGKMIVDFASLVVNEGEISAEVWTGDDVDGHSKKDAIKAVSAVLEGTSKVAKLAGEATDHMDAIETYTPDKFGKEWSWKPSSFLAEHLRKVGKYWIVVSTNGDNTPNKDGSIMVLILTDAWK